MEGIDGLDLQTILAYGFIAMAFLDKLGGKGRKYRARD